MARNLHPRNLFRKAIFWHTFCIKEKKIFILRFISTKKLFSPSKVPTFAYQNKTTI